MRLRVLVFILILFLTCQLTLTGCNSINFKTSAAQSQWVTSTLKDPKTFNYALNQEYPHVFLFTVEGLTTLNGETGEIEPVLAESWQIKESNTPPSAPKLGLCGTNTN
ncbi:MAG: hypothetical protein N4J56_002635 [Chroococcidiopsis sp. SAG 2025]|nr:hypothetical protein [Chroococcidiopsis sp. SAG 2025]